MSLYVIAYPVLPSAIVERIRHTRAIYDRQYHFVGQHFTLVFDISDVDIPAFITEIRKQAAGIKPISFDINEARAYKDGQAHLYHTFLVPDKGYEELCALHDRLYSGTMAPYRRTEPPFVPHITIGSSTEEAICRAQAKDWNWHAHTIDGRISTLEVVSFAEGRLSPLAQIAL